MSLLELTAISGQAVATVGACAAVGAYAHRQGILDGKAQKSIDKLVTGIFLPSLVVGKVTPNMTVSELYVIWPLILQCVCIVTYGLLAGVALSAGLQRWYPAAFPHYRGLAMVALGFPNAFSVPMTLMLALGDHAGLLGSGEDVESLHSRIALLFLMSYSVWVLARWSIGFPILSGALSLNEWCKKVLNPPVLACIFAVAVGLTWTSLADETAKQVPPSMQCLLTPLITAVEYAGRCSVPCILFTLGARLDQAASEAFQNPAAEVEELGRQLALEEKLLGLDQRASAEAGRKGVAAADAQEAADGPRLPCCAYAALLILRQGVGSLFSALVACKVLRDCCGITDKVVLMVAMLQGAGPPMINLSVMAGLNGSSEQETSKILLLTYSASIFTWTASISFFLWLLTGV